jgi:dipeptidase D
MRLPFTLLLLSLGSIGCGGSARPPQQSVEPAVARSQRPAREAKRIVCGDVERFAASARDDSPTATPSEMARRYLGECGAEDTVALTSELVAFPTVSDELPKAKPAFDAMARHMAAWCERAGLSFRQFNEHDAWVIELGDGPAHVGFVMHGDVVPVGDDAAAVASAHSRPDGWSFPPFEATRAGDKLYGRGTEDDKGPIAAVLVAMRALKALGATPTSGKIVAIIGLGEESNWDGMLRYAKSEAKPEHVISIDAEFPAVVAESGFVRWKLALPLAAPRALAQGGEAPASASADCMPVVALEGGKFLTQVPGKAVLTVGRSEQGGSARERLTMAMRGALRAGEPIAIEGDAERASLKVVGRAVHSSKAEYGDNAVWRLARVTGALPLCPGGAADVLALLRTQFAGDHYGQRLGLSYHHAVMGHLSVIPTVLRIDKEQVQLSVNMRRPAGKDSAAFGRELDAALARLQLRFPTLTELEGRYVGEPALADTSSSLVPTLMNIYRELTGDGDAQPISIRGGTYARLFPGAVSFGPSLPGHEYRGHAPDEYVSIAALGLMTRASLEVVLRL